VPSLHHTGDSTTDGSADYRTWAWFGPLLAAVQKLKHLALWGWAGERVGVDVRGPICCMQDSSVIEWRELKNWSCLLGTKGSHEKDAHAS
jgi:hypothetical protein